MRGVGAAPADLERPARRDAYADPARPGSAVLPGLRGAAAGSADLGRRLSPASAPQLPAREPRVPRRAAPASSRAVTTVAPGRRPSAAVLAAARTHLGREVRLRRRRARRPGTARASPPCSGSTVGGGRGRAAHRPAAAGVGDRPYPPRRSCRVTSTSYGTPATHVGHGHRRRHGAGRLGLAPGWSSCARCGPASDVTFGRVPRPTAVPVIPVPTTASCPRSAVTPTTPTHHRPVGAGDADDAGPHDSVTSIRSGGHADRRPSLPAPRAARHWCPRRAQDSSRVRDRRQAPGRRPLPGRRWHRTERMTTAPWSPQPGATPVVAC